MKAAVIAVVVLFSSMAWADQGENTLSLEPFYLYDRGNSGVGAEFTYMNGLTDFIRLGGAVQWDYVFGRNNQDVAMKVNLDMLIDAFEWVPYFRFGAGVMFPPKAGNVMPLLSAGFGLDWRPWPDYSIGLFGGLVVTGEKLGIFQSITNVVLSCYF